MAVEESILQSINKNGFPEKSVRLPFQAIFDACKREGTSLSNVLGALEEKGILNEIGNDKILFFSKKSNQPQQAPEQEETGSGNPFGIPDSFLKGVPDSLIKEGMEKMKGMDPQIIEGLKKQFMNMSPEERNEMIKKASEMMKNK